MRARAFPAAAAESVPAGAAPVARAQDTGLKPPVVAAAVRGQLPVGRARPITVHVNTTAVQKGSIEGPFHEVREEFEAATGATLNIVGRPVRRAFPEADRRHGQRHRAVRRLDRRRVVAGRSGRGRLICCPTTTTSTTPAASSRSGTIDDVLPGPRALLDLWRQEIHGRQRPRRPGAVLPPRPARGPRAPDGVRR